MRTSQKPERMILGVCAVLCVHLSGACGEETLGQRVDRHVQEAKDASEEAVRAGADAVVQGAGDAKDWVVDKHASGELSASALAAMRSVGDGVSQVASRSAQLAPVALEIGKVLYVAVDKDIDIEPIFQQVDDAKASAELDESIHDMPRVETIDGLEVGFKDLTATDSGKRSSESSYLVIWRQDEHLVGFVYRSKSELDIEKLISEAPRLIALANAAGDEASGEAKDD